MCIFILIYIVVEGIINITGTDNANRKNKKLTFKNAPLISCIHKILITHS